MSEEFDFSILNEVLSITAQELRLPDPRDARTAFLNEVLSITAQESNRHTVGSSLMSPQ